MCGLAAILDWERAGLASKEDAIQAVMRALKAMKHRGHPDWQPRIITYKNSVIGHIRLPIIDLDHRSDQPMIRDGTVGAFVGEIFNFKELGSKVCNSDTEVLIDEFNWDGLNTFHKFDGFWSAVLVNEKGPTVVTDYLGQKPLYFYEPSLLVVSEPDAALAALPWLDDPRYWDQVYRSNVLKWGYDPTGRSPFIGLRQLPAGSALTINPEVHIAQYWDWLRVPDAPSLRETLVQATANRLVGDRPVSLLLSGGLDSTIVLGILTQILKRNDVRVLHTENGESEYLEVALRSAANIRATGMVAESVFIHEAIQAHQVPVDLGSMIPQTKLARAVRKTGFYVCMSGDGADELFGGYRRAKEYDSQHSDTFIELPYYHLPRLDRIMMRSTVELRSPYLAPQVVKFALGLPWKARTEKQALKDSFSDIVPTEILNRAKFPLKSPEVTYGGMQWRQTIIDQWERQHVR